MLDKVRGLLQLPPWKQDETAWYAVLKAAVYLSLPWPPRSRGDIAEEWKELARGRF